MKIVYISSSTIYSQSANSIHVMKMCQAFSYIKHDLTLIARKGELSDWKNIKELYSIDADFSCLRLPLKRMRGSSYFYAWQATKKAVKLNPDIIYCRNLISAWLATLYGFRVVFESHNPISDSGFIAEFLFRRLIKSSALVKIVVITESLSNYYQGKYNIKKDILHVAPDGADAKNDYYYPMPLKGREGVINVGYVGHLYSGKGMEVILPLAELCKNVNFHVVGGTDKDLNYWREQASGLSNINFYGHVSHDEIAGYIQAFDIVLLPNQKKVSTYGKGGGDIGRWTSPLKAFEYMSAGKPIIASDLPVLKEVLIPNKTAVFARYNNPLEWAYVLNYLINEPEFRSKLGSSARLQFLSKYTWQKRAENIADFLRL